MEFNEIIHPKRTRFFMLIDNNRKYEILKQINAGNILQYKKYKNIWLKNKLITIENKKLLHTKKGEIIKDYLLKLESLLNPPK